MRESDGQPVVLIVGATRSVGSALVNGIEQALDMRPVILNSYHQARDIIGLHGGNILLAVVESCFTADTDKEIVDLVRAKNIPHIVLTSDMAESSMEIVHSRGAIDYVVKDVHAVANVIQFLQRLEWNKRFKVLVIDDSDSFRFALCSLLFRHMFQVVDADSAEAALEILDKDDSIEMVITDYMLPGMNGVELTQKVRTMFSKEKLAIIGISVTDDSKLTAHFIKNGANDFIAKPFSDEEFYCRINHTVEIMRTFHMLKEADSVKNQFLGMAAHDLRSPINGIHGLTDMLLADLCGDLNSEQRELIEYIHTANEQMNLLVNDLLDYSVIETGHLELELAEHDLADLVRQKISLHSIGAKKKGISLTSSGPEALTCLFDERRLGQVLDNLISNAVKFSPEETVVEVHYGSGDNGVVLKVVDHGQGIPDEDKDRLFKSFGKTSVRPTGGEVSTGLGLHIVKSIVDAHDGTIQVESVYGEGATFAVSFPLH